jgi:hypothetical protein
VRTLLEFLNLALSYHFSAVTNHIDIKVDLYNPVNTDQETDGDEGVREMPLSPSVGRSKPKSEGTDAEHSLKHHHRRDYVDLSRDGVVLEPAQISYPHCVYPLIQSSSDFTTNSCDIVTCYEDLQFCVNLLTAFVGGKKHEQSGGRNGKASDKKRYSTAKYKKKKAEKAAAQAHQNMMANGVDGGPATNNPPPSVFSVLSLTGVRVMIVDNVLGLHLPLVQLFLEDVQVNYDRDQDGSSRLSSTLSDSSAGNRRPASTRLQRAATFDVSSLVGLNPLGAGGLTSPTHHGSDGESVAGSVPDDKQMRVFGKTILWAEYFNNMKKCWEPLLEKLVATVLFEKVNELF